MTAGTERNAGVLVNTTISLDGFIAGPNNEMDWMFDEHFFAADSIDSIEQVIATTGAILAGRNTYEVGRSSNRAEISAPFGGRWTGPQFVLTHRPPEGPDHGVSFLSGSIAEAVETARAAAGEKKVLVLGAQVAQQCFEQDLVDEVLLVMLPILLGDGISLFGKHRGLRRRFKLLSVTAAGEAAFLQFARQKGS